MEKRRCGFPAGRVTRAAVEFAQGVEDLVDGDRRLQSFRSAQRRAGSDRRSIGSPGGEDGALLGQSSGPDAITTSLGWSKTVPGCSSALKSKTLSSVAVVGRMVSSIR